ncbi:MAG: BMP family ABC transporter substrate-binding protein, partial [Gammaproteobacteria bacterium]|nr:BMP family ABC transporter substrate-binding protein [Gammaproteobacteria bacterium]
MYYKIARSLVVGLLAATFLAGVSTSTVAKADGFALKGDPKPVFVYFNVKNDGGWVQALDEARLRMEKALGLTIPYVEDIPEVATEIRPAVKKFIKRGHNIILGSAFGYSDTFLELA